MPTKKLPAMTLVELVIAIAIFLVLVSAVTLTIRPNQEKAKARDVKRLADLMTLDRAINEFRTDYADYPDSLNITRYSNVLTPPSVALNNAVSGWIVANLAQYLSSYPTDPINSNTYRYTYLHTENGYELNAVLESSSNAQLMQNDGGNNPAVYELGSNLTLIN
jgi:type II secretory pathway pseudopilin PulG